MALPAAIYTSAQMRALDTYAIRERGVPSYTLMKRAAEASLRALRTRWPTALRIVVFCGTGNNGGDGYALARFARAAGLEVRAIAVAPADRLQGDAKQAHDEYVASGGMVETLAPSSAGDAEVVVDAVLGIGLQGAVRGAAREAIEVINAARAPVFALDMPSGLDSDTGHVQGAAVRADATIAFLGLKSGLFLAAGPEYIGTLLFDDLGIEAPTGAKWSPRLERLTEADVSATLPRRAREAHKGTFGHVLVVGGGAGMPGAVRLAGEAALRVGAGLVTVAGSPGNIAAVVSGRPELMYVAVKDPRDLDAAIERADIVAIGPGLGRSDWARAVCAHVFAAGKPLVIDADALNLLAENPGSKPPRSVLTPHPGEAARLLGLTTDDVQADRLAAIDGLLGKFGGAVVLKGAGTLIAGASGTAICERGNPGMATAGMGDVLTGVIAGVYAQCRDLERAARVGVLVHANAGDVAARDGQRGLLASDVLRELRVSVNR
jgi:NAD(P)H-hydrate epimerase